MRRLQSRGVTGAEMKTLCLLVVIQALAGCVTTQQQADGSTRVRLSLADGLGTKTAVTEAPPVSPSGTQQQNLAAPSVGSVSASALGGLFTKHPFDGTSKTYFPTVAVTVTDWSRNDCWNARATIWWSKSKSEEVAPFSVCWGQSLAFAVNNAANMHLFMQQTSVEHTGNVRTGGPKPPLLAVPDRQPFGEKQQLAFQGFIQQLVLSTGWRPGAPTNMWLVGYGSASAPVAATSSQGKVDVSRPMDPRARAQFERALTCASIDGQFEQAERLLKQLGWESAGAAITLPESVDVYGFSVKRVEVGRDGFEHVFRSYLPGVGIQQVVKAAALKLGKDRKSYGRVTKLGVLEAAVVDGQTTLTCTVNVEGEES